MGTPPRHLRPVAEVRLPASAHVDNETAMATIREWGERTQAERVAVRLDSGTDDEGEVLEWEPAVAPPSTSVGLDLEKGEILAPMGVVAGLAEEVLALARALGGRSVASADFPTRDPDLTLTVAAREGEGVVLAAGDLQFEY